MARSFQTPINMNKLEIRQLVLELIAGDPGSPTTGQVWFDTALNRVGARGSSATYKLVRDGGDLTAGSVANSALTTNPLARANHTGTQTASTISDFDTQVRTSSVAQLAAPGGALSMNAFKITNLATPTAATDAANKQYVDDNLAGLSWKNEVRLATTAAGTLASSFANGSTVDSVTLATNDRILIKDQAAPAENGIYTVNASGAPTRATDADAVGELNGAAVFVTNGTINGGTRWVCNTTGTITPGSTSITFVSFGGGTSYTAGNGLTLSTNDFNVGAGTGISVAADTVGIDTAIVARWKTALIGNGVLTSIAYNHALGNQWVTCQVVEVATLAQVECDVVLTDANNVTITFAVAPASNAYRVIVVG